MGQLDGKVCVVTGAASGIGQQVAIALAIEGAHIVVLARDGVRMVGGVEAVKEAAGATARVDGVDCDFASLSSIRKAAASVRSNFGKVHLLVHNMATFHKARRTSADGYELGFAINNLAPFVLSNLLAEPLAAAAPSRIVMMTMTTSTPMNFDDPQSLAHYDAAKVLEMTKGAEQYTVRSLARRLEGKGVAVVAVDPGLSRAELHTETPPLATRFLSSEPSPGVSATLSACLDKKWKSGDFVDARGNKASFPAFVDDAACERLWALNEKLAAA